ncbi:hypothetical protein DOY81_001536 [Sarcophaga bullata]|nr:hypothetical protein DOY81_001536 [Sarcophaga bullata]
MFNFHKPRTYRSTEGCCICKAKSSSSRFTDSRKYERDTMQCFDLKYPRQGEICNACVLLVKRFKRLPVGSKRNWSHVVDAKAGIGPGCSKIQTKYKSERISSRAAQANSTSNTASTSSSGLGGVSGNATNSVNGASSYMPEKFSKIFKKTKKIRDSSSLSHSSKRKSTNNGWSQSGSQSLSTTPDSLDSDYEDTRINAALGSGQNSGTNVVEFQTQTRASAYRAQAAAEARKRLVKMGSKRRKLLMPRKNNRPIALEETVDFFDEEEWRERKSCCGMLYECPALGGALLINEANYKPCEQHRSKSDSQNVCNSENKAIAMPLQKTIIQTMPAVVQLQPPQASVSTSSVPSTLSLITNTNGSCKTTISTATPTMPTPTPALKKHHLFFKRQSECFPQGDMVAAATPNTINNDINSSMSTTTAHVANIIKTETEFNVPTTQPHHHHHPTSSNSHSSTNNLQRHNENAITSSSSAHAARILTPSPTLSISVTAASASSPTTASIMPQMPKHSLAKVTTISPTLMTSTTNSSSSINNNNNSIGNSASSLAKPNGFLHKVKPEPGKIVKHSLEKFNTAVRLKTSDIHDMKPIIKTVDKSYILAKPSTQANVITLNAANNNSIGTSTTQYPSLAAYNVAAQSGLTTTSLSAASPTSSTSSTSSTKFSDNSSDSGFDENMLDRKSASPLQEDCEKKLLSRPGVHTMFLASGVQIQGQAQNLLLTGNEVAAKILQNRKYSSLTTTNLTNNSRSIHHPTTTAVKIAQIPTNPLVASTSSSSATGPPTSMSSAAQAKMRAIYNNNNTIQHENGITTIVPASSLAATTQTAAMQNIAPSTVTITPAPPVGAQFNTQNVISRKLTTANIINLQSNTHISNPHNATSVNHHATHHHHLNGNGSLNTNAAMTAANQKIILLKTSPNTTVTATTNYNNLHTTNLSGVGNGGGGLGITR